MLQISSVPTRAQTFRKLCTLSHICQSTGQLRPSLKIFCMLSVTLLQITSASFSTKLIGQSNPLAGGSNTITVIIETTADLLAANSSVVTISGLTNAADAASLALTSVANSGASLFSDGSTQGKGALSSGTLTLTVHTAQTVLAGTQYAFSFTITNPSAEQNAAAVTIAASGTASFAQEVMVAPNGPLLGVVNGTNPLLVVLPEFDVRKIGQSNPLAGGSNTITVTIQSNVNLAQATHSSVVTISGLTNATDAASLALTSVANSGASLFSDGSTQGKGALSSGTLTLTVHTAQTVLAGTQYAFSFTITNPSAEQNAAAVTIAASGTAVFPTSRGAMTTDTGDRYGVTDGGKPIKVIVPSFSVKTIRQSTPLAGATVTISVILTANVDFPTGSTVTIAGLTGTQTASSGSLAVNSSGLMGTSGVWTQSLGTLVLTAASGGTAQGAACTVTFDLQHAAAEYTPPTVSISAVVSNGSTALGSIAQAAMVAPNGPLLGVVNGTNPLLVVLPEFDVRKIGQSNPLAGGSNTITVTIQSNVPLSQAYSSVVTISGLSSYVFSDGAAVALILVSGGNSGESMFSGIWTQVTKSVTLAVAAGRLFSSDTSYAFSFVLTNVLSNQNGTLASVSASGSALFPSSRGSMNTDIADRLGVVNGGKPNKILVPAFTVLSIRQSNPAPSALNKLTISLSSNCNLAAQSSVVITGLVGSINASSANVSIDSIYSSNAFGSYAQWTQTTGTLVLNSTGAGVLTGLTYDVSIILINPARDQSSPAISVSSSIKNEFGTVVGFISPTAMTKPGESLYGVPNGTNPLHVVTPTFSLKSIRQSVPVPGANNTIIISLQANYNLATGSKLTIEGLSNSGTQSTATLPVRTTSNLLGTFASWDQPSGTLILTATGGGTTSGESFTIEFELVNPSSKQSSPSIFINALAESEFRKSVMDKPGTPLYGVTNGADPLEVLVPTFTFKTITQSTPLAGATVTISVILTANVDFPTGSTVTIAGLTGTQTATQAPLL
jgi:hypothetical protein